MKYCMRNTSFEFNLLGQTAFQLQTRTSPNCATYSSAHSAAHSAANGGDSCIGVHYISLFWLSLAQEYSVAIKKHSNRVQIHLDYLHATIKV